MSEQGELLSPADRLRQLKRSALVGIAACILFAIGGIAISLASTPEMAPVAVIVPAFAITGVWLITVMTGRQIKDQLLAPLAQGLGLAYRAHPKGIFAMLPEHLLPKYSEGVGGQAWDHVTGTLDGVAFEFAELQKRKANSNFRGFMVRTAAWRDLPPFMFADERRITSFGIERAPDRYDNMERVGSKSSPQGRTIGLWAPQGQHGAERLEPCLEAILSLEGYFGGDCRFYNAVNSAEGLFVTLETSADLFEVGGIFTAPHLLDAAMTKARADFDLVLGAARKLSSPA